MVFSFFKKNTGKIVETEQFLNGRKKLNSILKNANPLRLEVSEESGSTSEYSGLRETTFALALLPKNTLSPSASSPLCGLSGGSDCKM